MKKTSYAATLAACLISPLVFSNGVENQYGTASDLVSGQMGPVVTVGQALQKNNFGLGAGDGLGEMVMIGGHSYIADADGHSSELKAQDNLSFLTATEFKPDISFKVKDIKNIKTLQKAIKAHETNENLMYAIRVTGEFNLIKARSENKDHEPYTPIVQWMKGNQHKFSFEKTQGDLVIFQSPKYIEGIGVPGFHTHFISKDKKQLGHVFDSSIKNATVEIQTISQYHLNLRTQNQVAKVTSKGAGMKGFHALETNN